METSKPSNSKQSSTFLCLNPRSVETRPRTPDQVRKWRKKHQPGKKVLHPGIVEDFEPGHSEGKVFGITGSNESDHVEDIWTQPEGECARTILEHKESHYKQSAPLGKSQGRGHAMPEYMKDASFRHGVTTENSQDCAKSLLYPNLNPLGEDDQQEKLPGRQRSRHYNWPIDPKTTIFGDKGNCTAERGSSTGVFEALNLLNQEDCEREATAAVATVAPDVTSSKSKPSLPEGMTFGKTTKTDANNSAAECLQFDSGQHESVEDLGTSKTPGFRNAATDRRFGQPSIRTDIPQYARNSLADQTNYGDHAGAEYLLRPSHFASLGLDEDEFQKPRSKKEIKDIFSHCGYIKDDAFFDMLYDSVVTNAQGVDIETFRDAYNEWSLTR